MKRLLPLCLASLFLAQIVLAKDAPPVSESGATAADIVREINLARQNPALYATFVEELRGQFQGDAYRTSTGALRRTKEGTRALDEAIRFLRSAQPEQPLTLSIGMSRAAADHCAEQAGGRTGHGGMFNGPGNRISRYGSWSLGWGENIAYGERSARDIVLALIIDDGVRGRGHRKNIFNANFNYAGAAVGPHAVYRTVCSIDFAGGYAERGQSAPDTSLFARNF